MLPLHDSSSCWSIRRCKFLFWEWERSEKQEIQHRSSQVWQREVSWWFAWSGVTGNGNRHLETVHYELHWGTVYGRKLGRSCYIVVLDMPAPNDDNSGDIKQPFPTCVVNVYRVQSIIRMCCVIFIHVSWLPGNLAI